MQYLLLHVWGLSSLQALWMEQLSEGREDTSTPVWVNRCSLQLELFYLMLLCLSNKISVSKIIFTLNMEGYSGWSENLGENPVLFFHKCRHAAHFVTASLRQMVADKLPVRNISSLKSFAKTFIVPLNANLSRRSSNESQASTLDLLGSNCTNIPVSRAHTRARAHTRLWQITDKVSQIQQQELTDRAGKHLKWGKIDGLTASVDRRRAELTVERWRLQFLFRRLRLDEFEPHVEFPPQWKKSSRCKHKVRAWVRACMQCGDVPFYCMRACAAPH